MAYETGERLRCNDCGAEIMFVKPCLCPPQDSKSHANVCCGEEMERLGADRSQASEEQPRH